MVLGVDPGTKTGWAIAVDGDVIKASGTERLRTKGPEGTRYSQLSNFLNVVFDSWPISVVAVEDVRRHLGTRAAHVYGGLRAVIALEALRRGIEVIPIPVGTVKKRATGRGNADKAAMIKAATALLRRPPTDDNEADAVFVALCGLGES